MKLAKTLANAFIIGTLMATPLYAESSATSLTPAETGTLATIAAIDKNEILVSVIAANKKLGTGITDFADMMIAQHGENLTDILTMVKDAYSLSGGESEKISAAGKKDLMKLGAMNGADFATAYVNAMVKGHEGVLNLIDTQLMKTATSEEMKKFLTDTRATVATHLAHAKKLQDKMKS